jgi:hypothetical protein
MTTSALVSECRPPPRTGASPRTARGKDDYLCPAPRLTRLP